MQTIELQVPDMACAVCANKITTAIQAIDATAVVAADPQSKQVKVQTDKPLSEIAASIIAAGYAVR